MKDPQLIFNSLVDVENIKIHYWDTDSGQHFGDSFKNEEFIQWFQTIQ